MGKRKSSAPPPEKKKQKKVPTTFNCPFCEGRKTVGVKLKYKLKVATVKCRSCKIQWSCKITSLDEPVDVMTNWIDACKEENEGFAGDDY